ncbi:MAG: hypothetical protein ACYDC1_12685 [Limisphaerales bacterium]
MTAPSSESETRHALWSFTQAVPAASLALKAVAVTASVAGV